MELEDKLSQSKQLCEDLRLQAEAPTQDNKTSNMNRGGGSESEEVLQLHEQLTDMHSQLTAMEN